MSNSLVPIHYILSFLMWFHLVRPLIWVWLMEVTGQFLQFLWEDSRDAASEMWDVILAGSASGSPPQGETQEAF